MDYTPFGQELPAGMGGRAACYGNIGYPGALDTLEEKYTGKERDAETGLDFFVARYMGSAPGRFASPDEPLSYADPVYPQSWNLYSYVDNNPLGMVDGDGHIGYCPTGTDSTGKACKPFDFTNIGTYLFITLVKGEHQTMELGQKVGNLVSGPRDPLCTASYTALGGSVGFWAGGGLGSLGLAGGAAAVATIPGGAMLGTGLGAGGGRLAGQVLCSRRADGDDDEVGGFKKNTGGGDEQALKAPKNVPTGTRTLDDAGLSREAVHGIKQSISAGPKDWVGVTSEGHVVTNDGMGGVMDHGPWSALTHYR